jgi:hypothetical protein
VRAVTDPINATTEKPITAFPTMNTVASGINVAGFLDMVFSRIVYQKEFEKANGRPPTFMEGMKFMVTGDRRPDPTIMEVVNARD